MFQTLISERKRESYVKRLDKAVRENIDGEPKCLKIDSFRVVAM